MENDSKTTQRFSSPIVMAFALIAGSVGTGNIWRFPRVAATNGGGAFIVAYVVIMLLMTIPLMMGESAIGRITRKGLPGAFRDSMGNKKFTFLGSFVWYVVFATTAYYAVVMAWITYYMFLSLTKGYVGVDKLMLFEGVSNGNPTILVIYIGLMVAATVFAYYGVKAIEKTTKYFLPILVICLIIVGIRSVTLQKASLGLDYLFHFNPKDLFHGKVWLEAITQASWSAGPGWGICLAYGVFAERKKDITLTTGIQGLGDMSVALLSGIAIIPSLFSMMGRSEEALAVLSSGNNGLAFIGLTNVFENMRGGMFMSFLFFLSLLLAGFTSLIALFSITYQPFDDAKYPRKKTVLLILVGTVVLGIPSAWNIDFFNNQDFVVGMTMVIGAIFSSLAIAKYGTDKTRAYLSDEYS
ncbi:MAG: sodium-dependent transporter, partial [Tissierellia bacterium]|nr:sodium-dependent transporter [Tissierellia bacterium]